ncbi:THO complex subunit 2 [Elsinoe australis]|uniref:THO complex subunit 2 n=1 Tax=Elsinoe australis TaxID=40998 RepID=A0A2P8A0D9_9PEZI|nr:THO complex subunit 2 [Elsinoe australis]
MSTTSRLKNQAQASNMLGASAPGVLSMLRTSTDTGDLGMLSVNQGRMPPVNRQTHRNRAHPARLSDGSLRSNQTSRLPKRSSNNPLWEGSSAGHRGSISSLQTTRTNPHPYDTLGPPPHPPPVGGLPPNPSPAPSSLDGRSYSLTQGRYPHSLAGQRSVSSLRSQGATPRMHPNRGHPGPHSRPMRQVYRSVSPALSDYHPPRQPPPGSYVQRPPMPSYHSDYAYGHPAPSAPQPRYPPMPPASARYMQPPMQPAMRPPPNRYMQPPMPLHDYEKREYMYQPPPPVPIQHRHAVMYAPPMRQGLYPHHMPPRRAYTPGLDATPPSPGPNSSAPHSSNPSTPQDVNNAGNVAIDPEFIDPALGELHEETSEQAVFSNYIAYTNKAIEMAEPEFESIAEQEYEPDAAPMQGPDVYELEAPYKVTAQPIQHVEKVQQPKQPEQSQQPATVPSPAASPQGGLVQRMKALLENKNDSSPPPPARDRPIRKASEQQLHREKTVAELPATPVKVTEIDEDQKSVSASRGEVRITRDLVRATLSPSSSEHDTVLQEPAQTKRFSQHELISEEVASVRRPSSEYPSEVLPLPEADGKDAASTEDDRSLSATSTEPDPSQPSDDDVAVHIDLSDARESRQVADCKEGKVTEIEIVLPGGGEIGSGVGEREKRHDVSPLQPSIVGQFSDEACDPDTTDFTPSPAQTPLEGSANTHENRDDLLASHTTPHIDVYEDVDANAGVTSDIVTDIAVRFSIPRQTSMPKASIIRVSSLPEQQPKLHKDIHELPETISPRESVYRDMDTIAPLQVTKSDKQPEHKHAQVQSAAGKQDDAANLSSFIRRSFPRRHSAFLRDKIKNQVGSNKENEKPSSDQSRLSDLEEASQEDIPSAKSQLFTSHLPTSYEHADIEDEATKLRSQLTLSEIRNLPSLNFSQMNLIDQLNAALDNRTSRNSRSIEIVRKHLSGIASPSPLRPSSTEALRERYTSFFAKPEDFHVPAPADESESMSMSILTPGRQDEHQRQLENEKARQEIESSEQPRPSTGRESRSLSPTELIGVASEANRISIPSVDGLSYRLSELLPSLKRLHLNSTIADEQHVKQTIDEIHHLGERPTTMLSARSSGVLRSLAAIADDIATNGTHSSQYVAPSPRYNKSLPPLPKKSEDTARSGKSEDEDDTVLKPDNPSAESDSTVKAPRRRTQSEDYTNTTDLIGPAGISTTRRSLTVSNSNSCPWNFDENYPWNFDENYPWSSESGPVDINLKADFTATPDRESIASHILRAKATGGSISALDISLARVGEDSPENDSSSAEVSELEPTATVTADTLTGTRHQRVLSKKATSILGSLSRRAKLTSPLRPSMDSLRSRRPGTGMSGALSPAPDDVAETAIVKSAGTSRTAKSKGKGKRKLSDALTRSREKLNASAPLPLDSALSQDGGGKKSHAHAVSDRYPFTALTPPLGYDLDEVRSYFSDDAESTRTGAGSRARSRARSRAGSRGEVLRKRLSGLRFGRPAITVTRPVSETSWISGRDVQDGEGEADELGERAREGAGPGRSLDRARTVTGVLGSRNGMGSRNAKRVSARMASSLGNRGAAGSRLSYMSRVDGQGEGFEVARGGTGTESGVVSPDWFIGRAGHGGEKTVQGMGRMELGIKRLGDKVRGLLCRGDKLLRRVSGKQRRERYRREGEEWLEGGSMYSGT